MSDIADNLRTGLGSTSFPKRLYDKALRLGVWNPSTIDFTGDRADWSRLDQYQRNQLLYFVDQFHGGEEAVTVELLPLVLTIAREGRLDEELFLTTFLFDEGKHTRFFGRWLDEVAGASGGVRLFRFPAWRRIFEHELPDTMDRLLHDPSPQSLVRAAVTYNMIVEGVLAETGYHAYHEALSVHGIMPGLREGLVYIKRDEARHIAYGVYLLSRLVAADGSLWSVLEDRMNELFPLTIHMVSEGFRLAKKNPFGLSEEQFVQYATRHFRLRYERIRRACGTAVEDVDSEWEADEDADEWIGTAEHRVDAFKTPL